MLTQDATVNAAIIGAIALLIGSVLTLAGVFVGPYIAQRLSSKAEQRTLVREKIEAIYTASHQVADWTALQVATIEDLVKRTSGESKGTGTGHDPGDGECPIDTIVTFSNLYLPDLSKKKTFLKDYRSTIQDLSSLCEKINKRTMAPEMGLAEASKLRDRFQNQNEELQNELIRLVPKS